MENKNSSSLFRQKLETIAKDIPKGKVATYGQLAKLAGSPGASRAVGRICSKNKSPENFPCHRVVASNGKLTGYAFGGILKKKSILEKEGVKFLGDVVDLSISQWHLDNSLLNAKKQ